MWAPSSHCGGGGGLGGFLRVAGCGCGPPVGLTAAHPPPQSPDGSFGPRLLELCNRGLFECLALNLHCLRGERAALGALISDRIVSLGGWRDGDPCPFRDPRVSRPPVAVAPPDARCARSGGCRRTSPRRW